MTTLTNEQQLTWDVLSNNAERLSHVWAKELTGLKPKKFAKLAANHINFMLANFSKEETARTLKTWLTTYDLPLNTNSLTSFDEFHNQVGLYILDNLKNIVPYENDLL